MLELKFEKPKIEFLKKGVFNQLILFYKDFLLICLIVIEKAAIVLLADQVIVIQQMNFPADESLLFHFICRQSRHACQWYLATAGLQ